MRTQSEIAIVLFVVAIVLSVPAVRFFRARRVVSGLREKRVPGAAAFAASLGRPSDDPVAMATFMALREECGDELDYVRSDDDLGHLYGIVGEDLDDVLY